MKTLLRALVLATTCTALLAPSLPASAAPTRPLVNGHVSISSVRGSVPAGATVSVVQVCPAGSALDRAGTRSVEREVDADLDRRVRLASREFWPAGTVSRYRVTRRLSAADPLVLLNAALCTNRVAATATSTSGRASTDLRIWGPAPSAVELMNATVAVVTDSLDADYAFATMMAAAGVGSSRGSLSGGVRAVQAVMQEDDLGVVAAVGTTRRSVPRGRFVSMRNSYRFQADLTRPISGDVGEV